MGKSGEKVEFQVEKKMRLDQMLLLPLGSRVRKRRES